MKGPSLLLPPFDPGRGRRPHAVTAYLGIASLEKAVVVLNGKRENMMENTWKNDLGEKRETTTWEHAVYIRLFDTLYFLKCHWCHRGLHAKKYRAVKEEEQRDPFVGQVRKGRKS